jgi:PRC-barrel domain
MTELPERKDFGDYGQWPGRAVLDPTGRRIGEVREIYLDDATDRPEWVLVEVGEDGTRYVPLADATVDDDAIRVAHAADRVEAAPALEPQAELTQEEERRLYSHYGLSYSDSESDSLLPDAEQQAGDQEPDAPAGATAPPSGEEPGGPRPQAAAAATGGADAAAQPTGAPRTRLRRYVGDVPELPPQGETSEPADRGPMVPPRPEPVAPPPPPPPAPEPSGPLAVLRKRPAPLVAGIAASVAAIVFIVLRRRR